MRARVVFIAMGLLVALPGSAEAFSKAIWGPVYRHGVNQFPLYRQLGVSIYQAELRWSEVAPTRPRDPANPADPAYRWPADVGQAIDQAGQFHMRALLQLITAPRWANGGRPARWAPRHAADFAAFATAAARRYPGVRLWMIWGEPTRRHNFQPLTTALPEIPLSGSGLAAPHIYSGLLDAAYGALKRVSARNVVIGGCTFATGDVSTLQWIQNLRLPNGRAPRMDLYAHNPFTYGDPTFSGTPSEAGMVQFKDLPRLARWVDQYLRRGLRLFLSEWTIPTGPDDEFNFYVDAPVAARWITHALRLSRRWSRIYALGWVNVYDNPPTSRGGLLDERGVRKPGFDAFARG
jgi:hypothetical protein